jgi:hypothetical protein
MCAYLERRVNYETFTVGEVGRSFAQLQALYDLMIWMDTEREGGSLARNLNEAMG